MIQTPPKRKVWWGGGGSIFASRFGRGGIGGPKSAVTPVRIMRPTTLNSKISSISTTSRPLWSYGYTLWRVVYRNIRYMCINLVANITWGPGHAIRSSFPLDFSSLHHTSPLSTILADVSSQFSTLPQCNMIVLATRLMETLFGRQIALSMRKKNGQGQMVKVKWSELARR